MYIFVQQLSKATEYHTSSGQGMLGIGAALLGSSHVIGVDIDSDALETAQGNLESFEDVQASQHPQSLSAAPVYWTVVANSAYKCS